MTFLDAIPLLVLELELSLQSLTWIAQTGPPPEIMASLYEQGRLSVKILEARVKNRPVILEALAKNHEAMEHAANNKLRVHRKRAREEDLFCNETS